MASATNMKSSGIAIREVTPSDMQFLHALYHEQYPADIVTKHKSIGKYIKKAMKTDLKDIAKHYLNDRHGGFWVAVDKETNNIIGMIGIRENKSWKTKKAKVNPRLGTANHAVQDLGIESCDGPDFEKAYRLIDDIIGILAPPQSRHAEAEIMRFGVSRLYRRKGVGSHLISIVKEFCREAGYDVIVASTMNVLHDAVRFYKNSGFLLEHTEPCGNDTELSFLRFTFDLKNDNH